MMNMPMMVQNPAQTEEAEDQAATVKSSFNVKLMKFDQSKKVQLIKEIKLLLPDMNLVQVKKFVEVSQIYLHYGLLGKYILPRC